MIDYATPELAAVMVPRLLRGDETWCQGFSEPGHRQQPGRADLPGHPGRRRVAGHRARRSGPAWPSTPSAASSSPGPGRPESAHKGITALFVDMDSPGIDGAADRDHARCARVLRGLLRRRGRARSTAPSATRDRAGRWPWTCSPSSGAPRSGTGPPILHRRLQHLLDIAPAGSLDPADLGEVTQLALRPPGPLSVDPIPTGRRRDSSVRRPPSTRSWWPPPNRRSSTWWPTACGRCPGPRRRSRRATRWRREYLYSRAATIYGGTAEIQRNIIARRLLDLGAGPLMDAADRAALRGQPPPRPRHPQPVPPSTRPWTTWGGATR